MIADLLSRFGSNGLEPVNEQVGMNGVVFSGALASRGISPKNVLAHAPNPLKGTRVRRFAYLFAPAVGCRPLPAVRTADVPREAAAFFAVRRPRW